MDEFEIYLKGSLSQVPRLLALMDRSPFSKTYGSFDRPYWHHRTKDFSSAANQQGIASLALLWSTPCNGNFYFRSQEVLRLIRAGILFTEQIQNRDGSFDEWYINERGWAGPTAYVLHAVCIAFVLIKEELSVLESEKVKKLVSKSATFLGLSWEKDVLSNHIAISLLSLYEAFLLTGESKHLNAYQSLLKKFGGYFNKDEGWSLEYDGADIGYQTATLSFLSRIHRLNKDPIIEDYCRRSIDFLKYFCCSSGGLSEITGSRQTANCFHFGFEYWSTVNAGAAKMAKVFREGLRVGTVVLPQDQEDHYMIYRVPELLESYFQTPKKTATLDCALPFENRQDFSMSFNQAGIFIKKWENFYLVYSWKRGGCFQLYDTVKKKKIGSDSGIAIREKNGKTYSNQWMDASSIHFENETKLSVKTNLKVIKSPVFNPYTRIVFNIAMILVGWNHVVAYNLKSWIRARLMTLTRRSPYLYERIIHFTETGIKVENKVTSSTKAISPISVYYEGTFFTRVVPQTRYFVGSELNEGLTTLDGDALKAFKEHKQFEWSREF